MSCSLHSFTLFSATTEAETENPEGHIVLGGDNVPHLVEIGLPNLTKNRGDKAPQPPPTPPSSNSVEWKEIAIMKLLLFNDKWKEIAIFENGI
jgi:hypothetical protein